MVSDLYASWSEAQLRLASAERAAMKTCAAESVAPRASIEQLSQLRREAHSRFMEMMLAMEEQLRASRTVQRELGLKPPQVKMPSVR